jgi:hypothetical protein
LGQMEFAASEADAFPELPASGMYPVGHGVEWHATTLKRS